MILVTGGAGFIGSNLLASLEASGATDLVISDRLGDGSKWRNIAARVLRDIVPPENLPEFIETAPRRIEAVFHMGAISSTTATDGDEVVRTNFALSRTLWTLCAERHIPFIYASSAAIYGNGEAGFADANTLEAMRRLHPLNLYGWSKWLFDCWVLQTIERGESAPPSWAGLRFFNVYGPNEYHKGAMRSLVAKIVAGHTKDAPVTLFKSHCPAFADGQQLRDFVWVDDVVAVTMWLARREGLGQIVNVGSGQARSFNDLAVSAVTAMGDTPRIEYIDMPDAIRPNYQYYTCADLRRLRGLGYNAEFTSLENGVTGYVQNYLLGPSPYR